MSSVCWWLISSQPTIPTSSCHPNISSPSLTLPSNPTTFDLPRSPPGPYGRPSIVTSPHRDHHPNSNDLDQLRLDALTELQKSVVENGEGFVDKMRVWETHREQGAGTHGELKRSRSMVTRRTPDPMDDSDDVMILDPTPDEEVYFWEPPRKKRALSADIADTLDVGSSETTSALTDDDTGSSTHDPTSAILSNTLPSPDIPSPYPDRAVSALTLAFSNGVCGLNDYQAVLDAYNHTHYGEESYAGELWD